MSSGNDATDNRASDPGDTPPADDGSAATSTPPPGGTKTPNRWRTVRRVSLVVIALLLVIPLVVFLVSYIRAEVPRPSDMKTNQVATVFAEEAKEALDSLAWKPHPQRAASEHLVAAAACLKDGRVIPVPNFEILFPDVDDKE